MEKSARERHFGKFIFSRHRPITEQHWAQLFMFGTSGWECLGASLCGTATGDRSSVSMKSATNWATNYTNYANWTNFTMGGGRLRTKTNCVAGRRSGLQREKLSAGSREEWNGARAL